MTAALGIHALDLSRAEARTMCGIVGAFGSNDLVTCPICRVHLRRRCQYCGLPFVADDGVAHRGDMHTRGEANCCTVALEGEIWQHYWHTRTWVPLDAALEQS